MINSGIHVIDTSIDNPFTALLINEGAHGPLVVDITPIDAVELAIDLLETVLPNFLVSASGLGALDDFAERYGNITCALTAALPANPRVVDLVAFIAGRINPQPDDIAAHALGRLAAARDNLHSIVEAAKIGERD